MQRRWNYDDAILPILVVVGAILLVLINLQPVPDVSSEVPADASALPASSAPVASPAPQASEPAATATVIPAAEAAPSAATVTALVETEPVPHDGDAADDPAIWLHPNDPALSTIIGTDKRGGLAVYGLDGAELQYLPDGALNNVDLRYGFELDGEAVTLVAASQRDDNSLALYRVDPASRQLAPIAARRIPTGDAYGACMYRSSRTGRYYYFVNGKNGVVEQYELFASGRAVDARQVRSFDVGSQTEGCVADDQLGWLYIGEEEVGIWKYGAEPDAEADRRMVDGTGASGQLTSNVEGLALLYLDASEGYLLASSQGSDDFVVYARGGDNAYLARFAIGDSAAIDGVSGTDGIDVTNRALSSTLPAGLLVVQDQDNNGEHQNFKLVSWASVAAAAEPPLRVAPDYDPRLPAAAETR